LGARKSEIVEVEVEVNFVIADVFVYTLA